MVLKRAREVDARVVFASSAAVYGQPDEVPIPETAAVEPTSPYGLAKLAAERYVLLYAELYGVPTVTLRYFNVYGPRQGGENSGVITAFFEQARSGGPITVHGDGTETRDFFTSTTWCRLICWRRRPSILARCSTSVPSAR